MKKFFIFFFVVVIVATLFSCQTKTVDTKTVVKTTVKEIGSEGFFLKKVVKGDTVWGYSQESYGTGIQWREIVKENPFLNEEGRIYYDQGRSKWIVLIYPGEQIRIRGQVVTPTFISEETKTIVSSETTGIPWWGWLLIAIGSAIVLFFLFGMVGLCSYHRNRPCYPNCCESSYLGRTASMDYHAEPNGSFSLSSRGFGETTFSRDAEGRTTLSVRR